MKIKFPKNCPSCESILFVTQLGCQNCDTKVLGNFPLPILSQLSEEEQNFILHRPKIG